MSTLTKVFIVLTAVVSIAVSCLFIAAAAQWENWKKLAEQAMMERDAAVTQQMNAQFSAAAALALKDDALAAKSRELAEAQARLQEADQALASVRAELAQARNDALAFEAGRAKLQEILDVTTGELKALQKQNQELLAQNLDLQSRNARFSSRVLELTTEATILRDEVRNLQEKNYAYEKQLAERAAGPGARVAPVGAELPAGAVAVQPPVQGEIRGEIVEVSGNYASINVGSSSGVVEGLVFAIYEDGQRYVGDLEIERVRPNEAGGKIRGLVRGEVRKGQAVLWPPE